MAQIRINTRTNTKEKLYLINSYFFFKIGKAKKVNRVSKIHVCMWVRYAEGILVTFPWWLKNVKSRSKIALFSNERHFEIWFPKKKTITFFWSKLSKLHKKWPNFAYDNYIFPKTKETRTSSVPIPHPLSTLPCTFSTLPFTFPTLRFTLSTLPYTLSTLSFTFCVLPYALCTLLYTFSILPFAFCTLPIAFCTLPYTFYTLLFAFPTLPFTIWTLLFTSSTLPYALCRLLYTFSTLFSAFPTLPFVFPALPFTFGALLSICCLHYILHFGHYLTHFVPFWPTAPPIKIVLLIVKASSYYLVNFVARSGFFFEVIPYSVDRKTLFMVTVNLKFPTPESAVLVFDCLDAYRNTYYADS